MLFPKSKTIIILFIFLLFTTLNVNAQEKNLTDNKSEVYSFDSYTLDRLVDKDSLYKATILVNEAIDFSKKNNLKLTEAKAYNALGTVLIKTSNFKKAESYHEIAFKIFDSLDNKRGKDLALSGLVNAYVNEKNYKKFDSIYPIAEALSKSLNSEIYFINFENLIKRNYYNLKNNSLLETSTKGLKIINNTDFSTLNNSKDYRTENLKQALTLSYKYYNSIARVKVRNVTPEDYDALLSIKDQDLKSVLKTDMSSYRKLATLNYYKYLYFTYANKNLDSANKYLLKSDSYKYTALIHNEEKEARNGDLLYKIINAEQKLNSTQEI